jgi:S1-C subfamily serine protease
MLPRLLLAFALGVLLCALALVGLVIAGVIGDDQTPVRAAAPEPSSPAAPRTSPVSVADIYERVSPGVVFITARGGGAQQELPIPGGDDGPAATGSGFLIDGEGSIVTNDHVVGGSRSVTVRFGEGDPVDAELRGRDPSSDIALLDVAEEDIPDGVEPVSLGTSDALRPGDAAIAIGSPFGLSGTVTTGIISALDREITAPNRFTISGVLQTDAAINPGNSGGPLLDARGRAIGVNSQIATGGSQQSSGVGFAVPIDTVKEVVPALKRGEVVERAWLGVSTTAGANADGAVIAAVVGGGPADRAGLQPGDVVVKITGEPVSEASDIGNVVNERDPGDVLELEIRRGDDTRTVEVRLGKRPQEIPSAP